MLDVYLHTNPMRRKLYAVVTLQCNVRGFLQRRRNVQRILTHCAGAADAPRLYPVCMALRYLVMVRRLRKLAVEVENQRWRVAFSRAVMSRVGSVAQKVRDTRSRTGGAYAAGLAPCGCAGY